MPTSPPDSAETNRLLRPTCEALTGQPRIWTRTEANCEPLKFGHARNLRRPAVRTPQLGYREIWTRDLDTHETCGGPPPRRLPSLGSRGQLRQKHRTPRSSKDLAAIGAGARPPALFPELSTFLTYCFRFRPGDPVAPSQTIRPWPGRTPRDQKRPLKIDPVRRLRAARRKSCVSINEGPGCGSPQLATNQGVEHAYQTLVCVLKFLRSQNPKCLAGR